MAAPHKDPIPCSILKCSGSFAGRIFDGFRKVKRISEGQNPACPVVGEDFGNASHVAADSRSAAGEHLQPNSWNALVSNRRNSKKVEGLRYFGDVVSVAGEMNEAVDAVCDGRFRYTLMEESPPSTTKFAVEPRWARSGMASKNTVWPFHERRRETIPIKGPGRGRERCAFGVRRQRVG